MHEPLFVSMCILNIILFIYFIDLSQTSLHSSNTFQIDASKNITLYVKG